MTEALENITLLAVLLISGVAAIFVLIIMLMKVDEFLEGEEK